MRLTAIPILFLTAACAQHTPPPATGKARFSEYPETLFAALQSACEGPAQTFLRPGNDQVECREYLSPETTAAIILSYDGTTDDLPQLVIRFRARADAPGYLVENDVFLNVPQKAGPDLHVRRRDARLDRTLDALYLRAGGTPE